MNIRLKGSFDRVADRIRDIVLNIRESQIMFMAFGIAGTLLELSFAFYVITILYVIYMQIMTPMRIPWIFVISGIPAGISIVLARSRLAYCLRQAADPIMRRRFSRQTWKSQIRTGAATLFLSILLYAFCIGYLGTHLTLFLSILPTALSLSGIIFMMTPPPRQLEECLEVQEYGEKTPLNIIAPNLIRFLENDPFHLVQRE